MTGPSQDPGRVADKLSASLRLYRSGRLAEANDLIQQALVAEPDNADALHLAGILAHCLGQPEAAVRQLEHAIALSPDTPLFHFNLSNVHREQGAQDKAIGRLRQALALDPAHQGAHINLAGLLHQSGQLEAAADHYETALSLRPGDPDLHVGLADLRRRQGRLTEALGHFEQALSARPELSTARIGLAHALRDLAAGRYDPRRETLLKQCFADPGLNHQNLARPCAALIRDKHQLDAWPEIANHDFRPGANGDGPGTIAAVVGDDLLALLLVRTVNIDPELELFLTRLRRALFGFALASGLETPAQWRLAGALAIQGYNNDYVFSSSDEEEVLLDDLEGRLGAAVAQRDRATDDLDRELILYAMYRPLDALPWAKGLSELPLASWSERIRGVMSRGLLARAAETAIKGEIASLGEVRDATSRQVRELYEESPYPRWLSIDRRPRLRFAEGWRQDHPDLPLPPLGNAPVEILIAGCGTGHRAVNLALSYGDARILAVDLSRASLAYALRKAKQYGAEGIEFRHGDILDLSSLDRRFSVIECSGVLHHMEAPQHGWSVLTRLLRPGGLMKVGLYSEIARRQVVAARRRIAALGLEPSADGIRSFRRRVLLGEEDDAMFALTGSRDFHTLGGCHDLLFHSVEHRYTLPQLEAMIAGQGLQFLGFELDDMTLRERYRAAFPEDDGMTDLACWAGFEEEFPDTFTGMYRFWCQLPA